MSSALYNEALIKRAREAIGRGRLAAASASVTLDNPLCGDRVTMDVRVEQGTIVAIAHDVRGCLLCEAAASTVVQLFSGLNASGTKAGFDAISRLMLEGAAPPADLSALEVFSPVHATRSRRNCVLLPFRAFEQALAQS